MSDNTDYSSQLADALALAAAVHRGQLDLAGQPYILHVMRVVLECEGEELQPQARVVAALHDVVEDGVGENGQWLTREDAFEDLSDCWHFSIEQVNALSALTHRNGESYDDYITRVAANRLAAIVKRADLIDNLQPWRRPVGEPAEQAEARRQKYRRALARLSATMHDFNCTVCGSHGFIPEAGGGCSFCSGRRKRAIMTWDEFKAYVDGKLKTAPTKDSLEVFVVRIDSYKDELQDDAGIEVTVDRDL